MVWMCGRQSEADERCSRLEQGEVLNRDKWCGDTSLRELFPALYSIASLKDA